MGRWSGSHAGTVCLVGVLALIPLLVVAPAYAVTPGVVFLQSTAPGTPPTVLCSLPGVVGVAVTVTGAVYYSTSPPGSPGLFSSCTTSLFTGGPYSGPRLIYPDGCTASPSVVVADEALPGVIRQPLPGGAPAIVFAGAPYRGPRGVTADPGLCPGAAGAVLGVADASASTVWSQPYCLAACPPPIAFWTGAPYSAPYGVAGSPIAPPPQTMVVTDGGPTGHAIWLQAALFGAAPTPLLGPCPVPPTAACPYFAPRGVTASNPSNVITPGGVVYVVDAGCVLAGCSPTVAPAVYAQTVIPGTVPVTLWSGAPYVCPTGVAVSSPSTLLVTDPCASIISAVPEFSVPLLAVVSICLLAVAGLRRRRYGSWTMGPGLK